MIREKEIEEYIPKGKKTTITIDDCLSGYALKFEAYGFRLIGSNKDNICFYGRSKISRNYWLFEPKCRNNAEITYTQRLQIASYFP